MSDKYAILFVGVMVLLAACTGLLVFLKVQGKVDLLRNIFVVVLAVLIMVGCGLIFKLAVEIAVQNQSDSLLQQRLTER